MQRHPEEYRGLIAEDRRLQVIKLQAAEELRGTLKVLGLSAGLLDRLDFADLAELFLVLAEIRRQARALVPGADETQYHPPPPAHRTRENPVIR